MICFPADRIRVERKKKWRGKNFRFPFTERQKRQGTGGAKNRFELIFDFFVRCAIRSRTKSTPNKKYTKLYQQFHRFYECNSTRCSHSVLILFHFDGEICDRARENTNSGDIFKSKINVLERREVSVSSDVFLLLLLCCACQSCCCRKIPAVTCVLCWLKQSKT